MRLTSELQAVFRERNVASRAVFVDVVGNQEGNAKQGRDRARHHEAGGHDPSVAEPMPFQQLFHGYCHPTLKASVCLGANLKYGH